MGLYADYLESLREQGMFDVCMIIPSASEKYHDSLRVLSIISQEGKKSEHLRLKEISDQIFQMAKTASYTELYMTSSQIVNQCLCREKLLLEIHRQCCLQSPLVKDTLDVYKAQINITRQFAQKTVSEIGAKLSHQKIDVPEIDEALEKQTMVITMLHSIFSSLTSQELDEAHHGPTVFSDMAKLITIIVPNEEHLLPRQICKEYYVSMFKPELSVEVCDNCGAHLYSDMQFCLECMCRKE